MRMLAVRIVTVLGCAAASIGSATAQRDPTPVGSVVEWFSSDDYPAEAMRARQEGRVVVRLSIDATGKPISCIVTSSSGAASLDARACAIPMQRAVFKPAVDRKGRPVPGTYLMPVRWMLPAGGDSFLPVLPLAIVVEQVVDADEQRRSCVVRVNGAKSDAESACTGHAEMDEVLGKLPDEFRGRPLAIYSAMIQDYSGAPPAQRLDEADLTILSRITTRFTISTDGKVSGCRVEGTRNPQVWLQASPCNGAERFRTASGDALTHSVEATWTSIQAVRVLPESGGV